MDGQFDAAKNLSSEPGVLLENVPLRKSGRPSISNIGVIRATLRRIRPDLLLTYNWGAAEWALANRLFRLCPQIHFESGFGPEESQSLQLRRRVLARKLFLAHCNRVVVPSLTLYDLAYRIWHVSRDRLLYLPNGVDVRAYDRTPDENLLRALSIADDVPVVGTVAGLRPEKNLLRLIRVFSAIPLEFGAQLVIVGNGPEEAVLRAAAARTCHPDRIVFAGQLRDPSLLLQRFDVFALTSDTEQMPNAVLEAMAAGRAIAATDVGDTRRMVSEENAPFIISRDNEDGLTDAIVALLRDHPLRQRLGISNRRRAERHFSLDEMVSRYDHLYRETICDVGPDSAASRPNPEFRERASAK
jgi:glycosyltransferase involved in cell wall biosynthesis